MPPKKAAVPATLVGEYDIELMTENELKLYVKALQEEYERMRKIRNLCQRKNSELFNFLKSLQDDMLQNRIIIMPKNLELQDQTTGKEKKLRTEDERVKVMEIENINQAEKDELEAYINLITTKIHNREIEQELRHDISEKDKEIELLEFIIELIMTQSNENYISKITEPSKNFEDSFENLVTDYQKYYLENREKFFLSKMGNLQAILGEVSLVGKSSLSEEIAKLTAYFEDIHWKNIKTIKNLQFRLKRLEKEFKFITSNVRHIMKINADLAFEDDSNSPRQSLSANPAISAEKLRNLEELTCENYLLSNKLKMVTKEYHDMKKKFLFAIRRIYQIADLKTFLLEKKLNSLKNFP